MISGDGNGLIRVWDMYAGKQIHIGKAEGGPVSAAAFGADSGIIAAAAGGRVSVYDRRGAAELFTIKAPAPVAALEYTRDGKELAGLLEGGELRFWHGADGKLLRAVPSAASGLAVLGGGGERLFYANKTEAVLSAPAGVEIHRFSFEGASALAVQPGGGGMSAAAGNGRISVWNAAGKAAGSVKVPGTPMSLALDADGSKVFSGGEDGSVRMWDIATGEEIARYVAFGTTVEDSQWICITSGGYYTSSEKGSALLTVEGKDGLLTMDQFREALHRPDLVAKKLRGEKAEEQQKDGLSLAALLENSDKRPLVEIIGPAQRTTGEPSEKLRVRITDRGLGAEKIWIYNGGLCSGFSGLEEVVTDTRNDGGKTVYEALLTLDLKPGLNQISISVLGGREHWTMESDKARVEITTSWQPPPFVESRPALHVFTAAIEKYASSTLNLKYTKADAEALQKALGQQGTTGNRYAKVEQYTLYDAEVTREGFTRKFNEIKPLVQEQDTFVFFFSGHGAVDGKYKDFYFLPADAEGWTSAPERNILKHDLLGNLLKLKAENIFVMLDTCQSGALDDMTSAVDRAWTDLGQKTNLAILMAAAGNQYAIESEEDRQGVLTWTTLRSLEGQAERRDGRYMAVNEILEYVRRSAPVKAEEVVAKVLQEKLQSGAESPMPEPVGEVAVKGYFDTASLAQEPAVKPPRKNFDLFDLKWRPAEVKLLARSAGEVTMKGEGPERKIGLEAGKSKTLFLRDGRYEFTMNYKANIKPEPVSRDIVNETPDTVEFTGVLAAKPDPVPPAGFVYVKPRTFLMGSPEGEEGRTINETRHEVTLSGFFIAKYEVSQKEYAALMRNNPGAFKGDNNPVEQVSWFDAARYCNERSRREGLVPAYTINATNVTWNRAADGYRLPTEAEWEYACRAGSSGPYSVNRANFNRNLRQRGNKTNPLGSADPNAWGIYDMHGNVWEWGWLGNYPAEKQTDPAGPASGTARVDRGGGWYTSTEQMRSAYRGSDKPDYKDDSLGFRLARSIPTQTR